uniref:Uncharacterized protein n=1 Tax=Pyxicephalus adspersus TaxID=30357 RepID=A0AAV3A7G0_PYXAD|nr:TPA: hypothetical protein GDO54_016214 [Pyxicephalus adspersus]
MSNLTFQKCRKIIPERYSMYHDDISGKRGIRRRLGRSVALTIPGRTMKQEMLIPLEHGLIIRNSWKTFPRSRERCCPVTSEMGSYYACGDSS